MSPEVWAFLRKTVARRGLAPGEQIQTGLLGAPSAQIAQEASAHGFCLVEEPPQSPDVCVLEVLP